MNCIHLRIEPSQIERTTLARAHVPPQPICKLKETNDSIKLEIAKKTDNMGNFICPYYNNPEKFGNCEYLEI